MTEKKPTLAKGPARKREKPGWAKIGGFSAGPSQLRYVFYYNYLYTHVRCAPKLHLKRLEIPVGKNRVFFRS